MTPFDTAGDLKQFGKTNLTIMGKTVDEFTDSLKGLQGLGIRGIWDAFINGSTEAADALETDKNLIDEFKHAYTKDPENKDALSKITEQMTTQARVYVQQMDAASLSADDFAASQTRAAAAMNTLEGIGTKVTAVIGNMAASFAISAVVNLAIQGITYLIEREEKLRQATIEAGNALDEQTSSINGYKDQISSLRESLDAGNMSEQDAYDARKQLIEIQDALVAKFGEEAAGIDLVNGEYQKQLDLLNGIADKKANEYLTDNYKEIQKAQENMLRQRSYLTDRESAYITADDDDTKRLKQIMSKYEDQGLQFYDNGGKNWFTGKQRIDFSITADASQAKETLENLYADISSDSQLSDDVKDAINTQISTWSNQAQGTLDKWQDTAETGTKYLIETNKSWSELYDNLETAQNDYNEAVAKNDDKAIAEAVKKGKAAQDALRDSSSFNENQTNDKYVKQYLTNQAEQLTETTKAKAAQIGLQEALKNTGTAYDICQRNLESLTESEKHSAFSARCEQIEKLQINYNSLLTFDDKTVTI